MYPSTVLLPRFLTQPFTCTVVLLEPVLGPTEHGLWTFDRCTMCWSRLKTGGVSSLIRSALLEGMTGCGSVLASSQVGSNCIMYEMTDEMLLILVSQSWNTCLTSNFPKAGSWISYLGEVRAGTCMLLFAVWILFLHSSLSNPTSICTFLTSDSCRRRLTFLHSRHYSHLTISRISSPSIPILPISKCSSQSSLFSLSQLLLSPPQSVLLVRFRRHSSKHLRHA